MCECSQLQKKAGIHGIASIPAFAIFRPACDLGGWERADLRAAS
jgi:hypothetical protein